MIIETYADVKKAIDSGNGKYAFPGAYPTYFIMADNEALSFDAVASNLRMVKAAFGSSEREVWRWSGWLPIAFEINWEDEALYCAHTNEQIQSAYGEQS